MTIWQRVKRKYQLIVIKDKIKSADAEKILTGKRQFIIRLNNGKLAIVDSTYVKMFNSTFKGKQKPMTFIDLYKIAVYFTK